MSTTLTDSLFQTYSNNAETVRIDILYNNSYDFFYFETYKNEVLVQGDTRIVNDYKNDYVTFSSLKADTATFEEVTSFELEFLNA